MLSLLCNSLILLTECEDRSNTLRCELIAERRCLTPSPLTVVIPSHGVRPTIPIRDAQTYLILSEHLLERLTINRVLIEERLHHFVSERLLKPTFCKSTTTQIPIGLRLLWVREHLTALITHELVINLPKTTRPRATSRQCFPSEVVVIHNVDVVVQVPTRTIGVRHDKKVCTVHALGKLHTEVMHALDVLRIIHIELLRREILRVGVHLVATTNCRDLLSTRNKRLRFPHRARVPLSTGVLILILKALITIPTCTVQRVRNS